ncbi:WD repeat-containing protein 27 [Latimeria chalumnae]|uniref:WD repeat-containing protein 27 n=1 Tax=Latimeria chalumnae TaxID=7897 RepID=UPI00313D6805
MFENQIALLEINQALLARAVQRYNTLLCGMEKTLSVVARTPLLPSSSLGFDFVKKESNKLASSKKSGSKIVVKDHPVVFHTKVVSSGYTAMPRMTMFSPKTSVQKPKLPFAKGKNERGIANDYPLEGSAPVKLQKQIAVAERPTSVCCAQYSGDGKQFACGLADNSVLLYNSTFAGSPAVFTGHDGKVKSVGWSHDRSWLVSTSEDKTVRVWPVQGSEPALILGREMFPKVVQFAQFYYIDRFILLSSGPEFQLHRYYLNTCKDDIKRYRQRSVSKLVQKFQMAATLEITSLSAVNDFYSYMVFAAGSNRAVEVFDLNANCSAAAIPDAHCRTVHQICQNKGSPFSTQPSEAYNLFLTTAVGDGIKLWDLRSLRCVRRYEGHVNRCHPCGIAISPCGRFIATGSEDKSAYIYGLHSSSYIHKLSGHTDTVINVAFSPSTPAVQQ